MRFSTILLPLWLSLTAISTSIPSHGANHAIYDNFLTPIPTTPEHLAAIHASVPPNQRGTMTNSTCHTFAVNTTLLPDNARGLREITAECINGGKRVDAGDAYMAGMWLSRRAQDCVQVEEWATQMARNKWARLYIVGPRGWKEPCYFMGQTAMKLVDHCAVEKDNSVLGNARFWYAGSMGTNKLLRIVRGSREA